MKTPSASSAAVRKVMQANRGVDSLIELRLRSMVHKAGLRYSIDKRPEPDLNRRADLVFRGAKVAVYVHGCYWHGCRWHYKEPKSNQKYWNQKIRRNRERDLETRKLLARRGWKVMVYWEHQDPSQYIDALVELVIRRRKENFKN